MSKKEEMKYHLEILNNNMIIVDKEYEEKKVR